MKCNISQNQAHLAMVNGVASRGRGGICRCWLQTCSWYKGINQITVNPTQNGAVTWIVYQFSPNKNILIPQSCPFIFDKHVILCKLIYSKVYMLKSNKSHMNQNVEHVIYICYWDIFINITSDSYKKTIILATSFFRVFFYFREQTDD